MVPEAAGLEETSRDVVHRVPEPQGRAAEVLETTVESPMFVKPGVRPGLWH